MNYADSSALVSLSAHDANTVAIQRLVMSLGVPLHFCSLHKLEVRSAFSLGVFRRQYAGEKAASAWENLQADLRVRFLWPTPVRWHSVFRRASEITQRYGSVSGARSLDILHVACAESLDSDAFITFDKRQAKLAALRGLKVLPAP